MLGGRGPAMVAKEALRGRNYVALARMSRVCPDFLENARRYFLGRGSYPYSCQIRTPQGLVAPTIYSTHDMWTVNEVFCRRDYGDDRSALSVLDIGSNIGISALFFLTRNPRSRVWLYEPVPRNVRRLRENLQGYEDRYKLVEAAVSAEAGRVSFGVEESGRYGGIGVATDETIEVGCVGINDVLDEVLAQARVVDVLKIDTEGSELVTLQAIRPDLLDRVRTVYLEVDKRPERPPDPFDDSFHNETWVLRNRRLHPQPDA
jgi:FkbM family methyltransferase